MRAPLPALLLAACAGAPDDERPTAAANRDPALAALSPSPLPSPPPDVSNGWADDPAAAAFGQRLFFDTWMSGELLDGDNDGGVSTLGKRGEVQRVSCAGCHVPGTGYADTRSPGRQLSLAAGWGIRLTPSLLDVGQSKLLMWDGRHDSLYGQVFGPIESAVEMNSSRLFAAQQVFLRYRQEYEAIFGEMPPLDIASRFPPLAATETGCRSLDGEHHCTTPMRGAPGDGAEYDGLTLADQIAVTRVIVNVGKALGAYERLLSCGPSRFDDWVHGDANALSASEQRGAALFVGRADCVRCHSGPFLSDEKFHNVGLAPRVASAVFLDDGDRGAIVGLADVAADPLNVTSEFSDGDDGRLPGSPLDASLEGAFRTPRLRCASKRPAFMHTAHVKTLRAVVQFFSRGGDSFGYSGTSEIAPLDLTVEEQDDLLAFLLALDGPGPDAALLRAPEAP
jgi:cytochrome c peroxidase